MLWLVETLFCGGTEHGGGARKQNTSNQDGKAGCWVSFSTGSEDESRLELEVAKSPAEECRRAGQQESRRP